MGRVHGRWSDYAEYRYGKKSKRQPALPASIRIKPRRIFEGDARKAMIAKVADLLRDAEPSKWSREGPITHGLRSALVLQGHEFAKVDAEVQSIVGAALDQIGAGVRPSWEIGQRQYTIPRENCAWCASALDDEQVARGDRFCSTVCAKAAIVHRDYEGRAWDDELWRRAHYLLVRSEVPRRDCEHCGKNFQPGVPGVRFCSLTCSRQHRDDIIPDATCQHCGTVFHPSARDKNKYCSPGCASAGRTIKPPRPCPECGTIFKPHHHHQETCSRACAAAALAKTLKSCEHCRSPFHPKSNHVRFCSSDCHTAATNERRRLKYQQGKARAAA